MLYLLYVPVLTIFLLFYFRLAVQYKIIDKPNQRSSHSRITIRGAGIIFPIALFLQFLISGFQYPLFSLGLMLISLISFYDDLHPISNKIRILTHLIAVSLLFMEAGLINYSVWIIVLAFIFVIGTINAYNFMDGINGMIAAYSLVTAISLLFINENIVGFIPSGWLTVSVIIIVVFGFFNFRVVAKCFAGDVGSVSMAFILIFFILILILRTEELKYIALLLVYGLDSVTTIIFRILRRENIFLAHRSHFYQYLANSRSWSHLGISILYAITQFLINILILQNFFDTNSFIILLIISGIATISIRLLVEGKNYLLKMGYENQ